jgi:hypothetical protein
MRNYKKKKDSPPEFESFIYTLNLLPNDLDQFKDKMHQLGQQFVKEAFVKLKNEYDFIEHVSTVSEKYCDKLRQLVSPQLATKFSDRFIVADFREALDFFRGLADDKTLLKHILLGFEYSDGGDFFEKPLQRFTFNKKDSTLVVSGSQLVEILTRNKIPVERVRECPGCNKFFWAKRLDAKTCGNKKCVDKLSGKKYQIENKDEINRNKREKYYEDNGIAFCSKCVRPLSTHGESDCQLNGVEK